MTESRHLVTCNGRRLPLRNTGERGDFVAGVRFKAWQPPSVCIRNCGSGAAGIRYRRQLERTLAGRLYLSRRTSRRAQPETFPVNAYEAESRRLARFWQHGHTPGSVDPRLRAQWRLPFTLDLRRHST